MAVKYLTTNELPLNVDSLSAGDRVFISGTIYTARDAAHIKLCELIDRKEPLPFELCGSVIYYAGPTPAKDNGQIGSFGPTTSVRMDKFTPLLLENGLCAMIGKGDRSQAVIDSVVKHGAVYFCAGGGLGALISKCIESVEEIAFHELGCESIKKLTVKNMPLITAIDCFGNSIFNRIG